MDPDGQLQALVDAVVALDAGGILCALIGGIAVGVRSGVPRATQDVDLAVLSGSAVADLVVRMTSAGFTHTGTFAHSVNFRHPSGEPVQLALDAGFDGPIGRAEPIDVAGALVRVVTREDLIALKERSAKSDARRRSKALRDLADVELLKGDVGDVDEGW